MNKTPAQILVDKFGSPQAVADALNIDVSRVYRWTYEPDGRVPSRHLSNLLKIAAERNIRLTAKDLISGQVV